MSNLVAAPDGTAQRAMVPITAQATNRSAQLSKEFAPNPALFTNGRHELYLGESRPLAPQDTECVVHIRCNGICGSDIHFWKSGGIGSLKVNEDYVLGHEAAGVVVWVGRSVTSLRVGDRVAVEPGVPCEACSRCTSGEYNLCKDVRFAGAPPHDGTIRRYHTHPAKYLHRLPENMTFADGALLEPLSVVLHGIERSPLLIGEPAVICGAGPIGLVALAAARASGAHPLVITDVDSGRLAFAKKFVPRCHTVLVAAGKTPEQVAAVVRDVLAKEETELPRVVYECTGVESSVITAIHCARTGGEVMVIGVGREIMNNLPFMHASLAEIDLKFINRYHHSWPRAIRAISSGSIDLNPLVTHRYQLSEAVDALTSSASRATGAIKIHIEDSESA